MYDYFSPKLAELWDIRCTAYKEMRTAEELMRNVFLSARRRRIIDARQYKVLELRFYQRKSLEQTGIRLHVTRERIRQIEAKALSKIRTAVRLGQFDDVSPGSVLG